MLRKDYLIVDKLNSGASSVEKYKLYKDGRYYLLRIFDARFMDGRYRALENMEFLFQKGIDVPFVYEKGFLNDEKGYALIEWIEGISLDQMITSPEEEVQYGEFASEKLLKMHSIEVKKQVSVYDSFIESFSKKMRKITPLEVEQNYIKLIESYVRDNCSVLSYLNYNCIIHGDFHPGNIIMNNNKLVFIDMDVCKVSHPWEDLTSNACNMEFPDFYSSFIINYFNGDIPKDFWQVYNLYGCLYVLDYILYALRTDGKTLNDGKDKLQEFLNFTDYFQNLVPSWFNKEVKVRKKVLK